MAAVAQEFRANLQGIITDPSLAAVPSAAVILKNVETGIESVTASDPAGHYLFSYLPPGSYLMTVKAAGFKTMVRDGIQSASTTV